MSIKSEYDAAYFSLLRAREELEAMGRYQRFLDEELQRLSAVETAFDEAGNDIPRRFTKPVDATLSQIKEAIGRRRSQILSELSALPDRIEAQDEFVRESEEDVDRLRP